MITFSHPLQPAALHAGNWVIRWQNVNYPVQAAVSLGPEVNLTHAAGLADIGPDRVSYSPPPYDVISHTTKPTRAEAFTDYPLV